MEAPVPIFQGKDLFEKPNSTEKAVTSLYEMMIATIRMDIAQKDVVSRIDLDLEAWKDMKDKVKQAHQQSLTAKKAIFDFLLGVSNMLSNIMRYRGCLEKDRRLKINLTAKISLAEYCQIDKLEKCVSSFQSFNIESFKMMTDSAEHHSELSGEEAIKELLEEEKQVNAKYYEQFKTVNEAFQSLKEAESKRNAEKKHCDFLFDQIKKNETLKNIFRDEIQENEKLNRTLLEKRADPVIYSTSGWWIFKIDRTNVPEIDGALNKLKESSKNTDHNLQNLESTDKEIKAQIKVLKINLGTLVSEVENAKKKLKIMEDKLQELKSRKDEISENLQNKCKGKGQGCEQLIKTIKVGKHFVGILESCLFHQEFAESMLQIIRALQANFKYVDALEDITEKLNLMEEDQKTVEMKLLSYFDQHFSKKFNQMIKVASYAHDPRILKEIQQQLNDEEMRDILARKSESSSSASTDF